MGVMRKEVHTTEAFRWNILQVIGSPPAHYDGDKWLSQPVRPSVCGRNRGRAFIFFRFVFPNPGPCNVDAAEETVVENPRWLGCEVGTGLQARPRAFSQVGTASRP